MYELSGKTAVVTGAGGGIGLALAKRAYAEGMNVVLADLDEVALKAIAKTFDDSTRIGVRSVDVSDRESMAEFATYVRELFGSVHLLFNNAGVKGSFGPTWALDPAHWARTIDVNLLGVINGLSAFVPNMIADQVEGYIVNTASFAGLCPIPGNGPYVATKAAVVAISETLAHELRHAEARIGVSVLCPSLVATPMTQAPPEASQAQAPAPEQAAAMARVMASADTPEVAADITFDAIESGTFYILTSPQADQHISARLEAIAAHTLPPEPPLDAIAGSRN
ncbi:SDR family NAD(P)-dependent oxidoreductase [Nocardia salmonicida]|uniref:SDR family NAD(P)-dependent oxidoreductase n=1 Tax=Nocardia salmonicida TaxID=53431 RepID=UPI00366D48F9